MHQVYNAGIRTYDLLISNHWTSGITSNAMKDAKMRKLKASRNAKNITFGFNTKLLTHLSAAV